MSNSPLSRGGTTDRAGLSGGFVSLRRLCLPLLITIVAAAACSSSEAGLGPDTRAAAASVAVDRRAVTLDVGATLQLTATVRRANGDTLVGRTVTWRSSNTSIADVSAAGVVTAAVGALGIVAGLMALYVRFRDTLKQAFSEHLP